MALNSSTVKANLELVILLPQLLKQLGLQFHTQAQLITLIFKVFKQKKIAIASSLYLDLFLYINLLF